MVPEAAAGESKSAPIKVESEVMWYTTMALDDSSVLVEKFKSRHPAIDVKLFRANNSKILDENNLRQLESHSDKIVQK